jgi:hypothetical protein
VTPPDNSNPGTFSERLGRLRPAGPFLFAVLISTTIWVINSLNQSHVADYELVIQYPFASTTAEKSYTRTVKAEITGRGFDLIRFSLKENAKQLQVKDTGSEPLHALETVSRHLSSNARTLRVTRVTPYWINRPHTSLYSKRLKIIPDAVFSTNGAFIKTIPALTVPDSLTVFSERPIPEKLNSIKTKPVRKKNLQASWFGSVKPDLTGLENMMIESDKVWIYQPVEEATECNLVLPVNPGEGIPYNFRFIPASVTLSCIVPVSRYPITTADKFMLVADISSSDQERAVIRMIKYPSWATSIRFTPAAVDYLRVAP